MIRVYRFHGIYDEKSIFALPIHNWGFFYFGIFWIFNNQIKNYRQNDDLFKEIRFAQNLIYFRPSNR